MVAQGTRKGRNVGSRQSAQGQLSQMAAKPQELVNDYPFSSALLVFGVGLGVGVLLSQAFCESDSRAWGGSNSMSGRWGQKMHQMYDYLSDMVPESVSRRMS
jgi:hypothetical protein